MIRLRTTYDPMVCLMKTGSRKMALKISARFKEENLEGKYTEFESGQVLIHIRRSAFKKCFEQVQDIVMFNHNTHDYTICIYPPLRLIK